MVRRRSIDPTESVAALFGYKLRQHRDLKKWTQIGLADRVGCSADLISKIERADRGATPETSELFDELFGTGTQFQELQPLAARADIPGWFRRYAEYEQLAMSIRLFDPLLIPGLLQTEPYARAVLRARQPPNELDQLVAARMSRQAILTRDQPPWLLVLLLESAVRRPVGGPEVMRDQLQQLLDTENDPNITLQIIPETAPVYPAAGFTLFSFEDDPDIGWVDGIGGHDQVIERNAQVEGLRVTFDRFRAVALPIEDSAKLIRAAMESS